MQIEDHDFTVIATEVSYVKPISINTLYFMAGERYDFVIDTKDHPVQDYWIRFKQCLPCHQQLQGFAVLRYHHKGSDDPRASVEFNNRSQPSFDQEYPNGTVRLIKFSICASIQLSIFSSF
jgi:FtsP/CotA-like multicopper oxidase with cupredoxin domain